MTRNVLLNARVEVGAEFVEDTASPFRGQVVEVPIRVHPYTEPAVRENWRDPADRSTGVVGMK